MSGNTATWVTELMPNSLGFTFGKVTVVDNGPAGSGLDTYAAAGYTSPARLFVAGNRGIRHSVAPDRRHRRSGRPAVANLDGPVQERRLGGLRQLPEPGRLRELRGHER